MSLFSYINSQEKFDFSFNDHFNIGFERKQLICDISSIHIYGKTHGKSPVFFRIFFRVEFFCFCIICSEKALFMIKMSDCITLMPL